MSKRIELTKGYSSLVDDDDFDWLSQWKWCALVTPNNVYAKRTLKGILMHREIAHHHGHPDFVVDHMNHDGLDNRKENLRPCSYSQNNANRRKTHGSSRFKGVHFENQTQRWRPEVRHDGQRVRGPRFDVEAEAAAWYDLKAFELFGEFAVLNFPRT